MMTVAYGVCLIISIVVILYMAQKNCVSVNIHQWTIMVLIPVIIGAYFAQTLVLTGEAAYALYCVIYLDSTVLLAVFLFAMLSAIGVEVKPWGKLLGYGISFFQLLLVVCSINTQNYYREIKVERSVVGNIIKTVNGPLKYGHYVYLLLTVVFLIAILVVGYMRKGTYSFRVLSVCTGIIVGGLLLYVIELATSTKYTFLPFLYVASDVILAAEYNFNRSHELSSLIARQQSDQTDRGYMAIGLNKKFLGCNEKCKEIITELKTQRMDERFPENTKLRQGIEHFIDCYEEEGITSAKYVVDGVTWMCNISHFSIRKDGKKHGYLFEIHDSTEEEKTLEILNSFQETVDEKVKIETHTIKDIQRKIVMGMANLIENRDSNTGGHVKRTSDVVKILIEEINKDERLRMDEVLAEDIVRAAPMHDLGKIQIDSSILCKQGKLTDEEFDIMKSHSTKSAEIVTILLEGVEEEHFVNVCYEVALFHHEKWDGSGYPMGLSGKAIPFGARVMAVADVLDALMSRRSYKAPMEFKKAAEIMIDGMGKAFDPSLKAPFLACMRKLEDYYILANADEEY